MTLTRRTLRRASGARPAGARRPPAGAGARARRAARASPGAPRGSACRSASSSPSAHASAPAALGSANSAGSSSPRALAVELVLGRVDPRGLLEDLARDLLIAQFTSPDALAAIFVESSATHPRAPAPPADTAPTPARTAPPARSVPGPKARDRRVIGRQIGRHHPKRHILDTATLDRPRRTHPHRIRIEQQRDHQRRVIGRPAPPIRAITRDKTPPDPTPRPRRSQTTPDDRRQPLPQIRRQQQRLITIHRDEVLRHHQSVLNRPDRPPFMRQPLWGRKSDQSAGLPAQAGRCRRRRPYGRGTG